MISSSESIVTFFSLPFFTRTGFIFPSTDQANLMSPHSLSFCRSFDLSGYPPWLHVHTLHFLQVFPLPITCFLAFLDMNLHMMGGGFPPLLGRQCEIQISAGVHSMPIFCRSTTTELVSSLPGAESYLIPKISTWSLQVSCSSFSSLLFNRLSFLCSPLTYKLFVMFHVSSATALMFALTMTRVTAVSTWVIMGAISSLSSWTHLFVLKCHAVDNLSFISTHLQ